MDARFNKQGFSLVEIVIAMGVASFAVVAILGLLTVSFSAEKAAADDTEMAIVAGRLFSELRNHSFDETLKTLESEWTAPVYLRDDGASVPEEAAASYAAEFSYVIDASTMLVNEPPNLVRVRMEISSLRGPSKSKVFHACIARH